MHRRRSDERLVARLERGGVEDEGLRLRPAEAAVEGDELLERAGLVEHGVVEAADHDVGDVHEAVGAPQGGSGGGGEGGQGGLSGAFVGGGGGGGFPAG